MGDLYTVSVGNFFGCDAPSSTAAQLRGDVSIAFTCDPANKVRDGVCMCRVDVAVFVVVVGCCGVRRGLRWWADVKGEIGKRGIC